MDYILENDHLKVTVASFGAQLKSVIHKEDGTQHIWQADPSVWGSHAPILFPYTGRLKDGKMTVGDRVFENMKPHGFARNLEHTFVYQNKDTLVLQLTDSPETLAVWPWKFRLLSAFTIEGDVLHHTLTVENQDDEQIQFGIGFHPAFALPFDENHSYQDYVLRFDKLESPLCLDTAPRGLISGKTYYLDRNILEIPVDDQLFANDSHCMTGLQSETLGLIEKDTGRGVICSIRNFPHCLIWSKPGQPRFVCIEPWMSLPSPEDGGYAWEEKPAAARLQPGESWSTTLSMAFVR
jgi:aldose 1-epimerase